MTAASLVFATQLLEMPSSERRLPSRAVVVSFRFRPDARDIHGGQDAFIHSSLKALSAAGVQLDVVTFRGRDDPAQVAGDGVRIHLLETPFSRALSAHEAHRSGTWRLLEVMRSYSDAVERFLPSLRRAHGGRPLLILSHDVAEARWVKSARRAGDRIITFAHVLLSEFALDEFDLEEFERMHRAAKFPLPLAAIGRLVLRGRGGKQQLERIARLIQRAELFSLLPAPARAALEGERAAFIDAHRVLLPSAAMRAKVLSRYRREDETEALRVVPWAIELERAEEHEVRALALELGIRSEDRVLVTMSRISPDKRIGSLIGALELIEARDPALAKRIVAVICGRPTFLRDEIYFGELEARARRLEQVRVRFAGYRRGSARTAAFELARRGRGRFVQVGRYEAFGLGIVEALSLGIPVITSDTDGARAIFDSARCSRAHAAHAVVDANAGESFDAALAEVIARELSGSAAIRSAEDAKVVAAPFTWDAMIDAIAESVEAIDPDRRARARLTSRPTVWSTVRASHHGSNA